MGLGMGLSSYTGPMATAHDVAAAILERLGPMDTYKLQKLVYYAQSWHLAWYGTPLFEQPIEAWAQGPVVRSLYEQHRGRWRISVDDLMAGESGQLVERDSKALNAVLEMYGNKTGQQLRDLTHREAPWLKARGDAPVGAPGHNVISRDSMERYYLESGFPSEIAEYDEPDDVTAKGIADGDTNALVDYFERATGKRIRVIHSS